MIRSIAQDSIIIVIGGTDDLNYPVIKACSSSERHLDILRIDPAIDFESKNKK